MKLCLTVILGLLTVALSASADNGGPPNKCVQACNLKYTKPYLECRGVVECERFVSSEAAICIKHCGE